MLRLAPCQLVSLPHQVITGFSCAGSHQAASGGGLQSRHGGLAEHLQPGDLRPGVQSWLPCCEDSFPGASLMTSSAWHSGFSVITAGPASGPLSSLQSRSLWQLEAVSGARAVIAQLVQTEMSCTCSPLRRRLFWHFHSEGRDCLKGQPAGSRQTSFLLLCAVSVLLVGTVLGSSPCL